MTVKEYTKKIILQLKKKGLLNEAILKELKESSGEQLLKVYTMYNVILSGNEDFPRNGNLKSFKGTSKDILSNLAKFLEYTPDEIKADLEKHRDCIIYAPDDSEVSVVMRGKQTEEACIKKLKKYLGEIYDFSTDEDYSEDDYNEELY